MIFIIWLLIKLFNLKLEIAYGTDIQGYLKPLLTSKSGILVFPCWFCENHTEFRLFLKDLLAASNISMIPSLRP